MKKNDFTRIILLITSLLMLIVGFMVCEGVNVKILILGILAIISLVVLDRQAGNIVGLSENNPKVKTFRLLNMLTIFIAILCFMFVSSSTNNQISITEDNKTLVIGLISIFIMFFGNLSPKIPFNRYLGLRLPWTIRDEETWKVAHRLVGYSSFPIAMIMFVMSFFIDGNIVGITGVLTWVMIPSIYSYIFYYKKLKSLN